VARVCIIVLDAVGVGELPDAADFGDAGSSTLQHVAEAVGGLRLPNLKALGLGNMMPLAGCPPLASPPSVVGRLRERSLGKDTTTGHWELAGVITPVAMPTYPDGFPPEIIDAFVAATGREVIGNVPASGTEIIQELGDEHVATGKWIVYTSADSVFQIAAHERVVPLEELYDACRIARKILDVPHNVGRVIARPFDGTSGSYARTPNRHDFSLEPARPNHLTRIRDGGSSVHAVGKIADIFAGCDIDSSAPTRSNAEGVLETVRLLRELPEGLIFTNLVETDSMYGHRNDPDGFHRCLQEFDREVPTIRAALRPDDLLILCSDHGCDPTTDSTDHSREHALLVAHSPSRTPSGETRHDGEFADVGATARSWLTGDIPGPDEAGSPIPFLCAPPS
jgi:phosphopentomutase